MEIYYHYYLMTFSRLDGRVRPVHHLLQPNFQAHQRQIVRVVVQRGLRQFQGLPVLLLGREQQDHEVERGQMFRVQVQRVSYALRGLVDAPLEGVVVGQVVLGQVVPGIGAVGRQEVLLGTGQQLGALTAILDALSTEKKKDLLSN